MADDTTDVKPDPAPSAGSDVKETAQPSSGSAGATTDSPPAKKASDTPTPPPGKSNREALIASLSQDKKEDVAEGDEPEDGGEPEASAGEQPTEKVDGTDDKEPEPDADKKPEGDDTTVTGKPERAKKDVLIENLRKVSDENKSLRSIQNFAAPILEKLSKAKLPPTEFHQLTDTFISARARGVAADKLAAWVNLGTENLTAEDAGQRLYEMAVQHGYTPAPPAVPVVAAEDEAYIAAQRQAGLIDDEMAARMRKMAAKLPPAPAPKPRQQPPPQRQQPPPPANDDLPVETVTALNNMASYADSVRAQHKITPEDWAEIDKQIVAKLKRGGPLPVANWHSSFQLATDAVVADFLRRKPAATRPINPSLRPSKTAGAGADNNLSEREKVIRRLS